MAREVHQLPLDILDPQHKLFFGVERLIVNAELMVWAKNRPTEEPGSVREKIAITKSKLKTEEVDKFMALKRSIREGAI